SLSERSRLESECKKQADLLKTRYDEIENLKAQLLLKETEATEALQSSISANDRELKDFYVVVSSLKSQNDGLIEQVHALENTCSSLHDQVAKLDADLLEMALHLEEKFYPHLRTTISGRRWLLTRGLKLVVIKCLNSPVYLTALGSAISRAIEKGMQSGLSVGIDHGKAGMSLEDVVAYNLAAEADFNSTLQRLREVDFPLLAKLSSQKDAMNLLHLEGPFDDAPRMNNLQPDVEQLMLPIHRPEDQVVLGETSLSFSLSVAHSREDNVAAQRCGKYLWEHAGCCCDYDCLIYYFSSTSSVPPITIYDYEILSVDGQENAWGNVQGNVQGDVASFPKVEFEKEELDTTLERDPPS
nr:hypothetical protein [Tanacetum cinerariifolium]